MEDYPFLELLRQGPVAWNGWQRNNNPHVVPKFDEANVSGLVLDGANLDDAVLLEAVLANTSLVGASLRRAIPKRTCDSRRNKFSLTRHGSSMLRCTRRGHRFRTNQPLEKSSLLSRRVRLQPASHFHPEKSITGASESRE
jgi:pentapeptide repeat protein